MDLNKLIPNLRKQIEKAVDETLSKSNMQIIADEAAVIVQRRTRLGFGVDENRGDRKKLKKLSEKYKKQRGRLTTGDRLSGTTTPTKSNLTRTGQLLKSLHGVVTGKGHVEIRLKSQRDDGYTNSEIADFVALQGREFMNLSANEIKQLEILGNKILQKELNKILTNIS